MGREVRNRATASPAAAAAAADAADAAAPASAAPSAAAAAAAAAAKAAKTKTGKRTERGGSFYTSPSAALLLVLALAATGAVVLLYIGGQPKAGVPSGDSDVIRPNITHELQVWNPVAINHTRKYVRRWGLRYEG